MSRTKILVLAGSSAILLGVLLVASVNEVAGLPLLGAGILILLAGCFIFCWKGEAKRVMLSGAVISGVSLIVIPGLSLLAHFEPNVHGDWTGFLFFLWVLSCAAGPVFVLVGASRFFLQKRKSS